jgi:hypothetical protein
MALSANPLTPWVMAIALMGVTIAPLPARNDEADADRIVEWLSGRMDLSAQVARNPAAVPPLVNVHMVGCVMTVAGSSERWVYQEQFLPDHRTEPYRQRFLKIVPTATGAVSETYVPLELARWVGLCDRPRAERVAPAEAARPGQCRVSLQRDGAHYRGETQPGGCPTTARGAKYTMNVIRLGAEGMDTHDRGFAADGRQLWGSDGAPYEFRRLPSP